MLGGIVNFRFPPTFIPIRPSSQPFITCPPPTVNLKGVRPGLSDEDLININFALGKIYEDQVKDYAKRKNIDKVIAEKWLGSNLGYSPNGVN